MKKQIISTKIGLNNKNKQKKNIKKIGMKKNKEKES